MAYSIVVDFSGEPRLDVVRRDHDLAIVPVGVESADGRAYGEWLAAGNVTTPPAEPTMAERRAKFLAALADRRWRAETAGAEVSGMRLPSDEQTQAKLTAAVVASVLDNGYSVRWKLADGSFVLLDHAALIAAAQAVRAHVQGCFDREAELAAQIVAAADAAALDAIDIDAGWPT